MAIASSGMSSILGLMPILKDYPAVMVRMGHAEISAATTLEALGYSAKARVFRDVRVGIWGSKKIASWNAKNRQMTLAIYIYDEGLFCHLLNKVSKMIRDGFLDPDDYLGIYDDKREALCEEFDYRRNDDDYCVLDSDQMFWSLTNYAQAVNGDFE